MEERKKHISIFVPSLRGGGAEYVMVVLANGFANLGHKVDLVVTKAVGPNLSNVHANVNIVDLDKQRVLSSLPSLIKYIRDQRPDVMLSALRHANVVAVLACRLAMTKMRCVVSERDSLTNVKPISLMSLSMKAIYPFADHVISVSDEIAEQIINRIWINKDGISSIPNPVDIDRIEILSRELPDHPWVKEGGAPILLAVGRLEEQKDYPTLLRSFSEFLKKRNARLVILGEGSMQNALESLAASLGISQSVFFAGYQSNPFKWMRIAKMYLLTSKHEGFPNSLVQAMACGTRVVSTDCPSGPSQILENGKWGRLVAVEDVYGFSQAMVKAFDDPSAPNVRDRVKSFGSIEIVNKYLKSLEA